MCSVWLTVSQLQSISSSAPCIYSPCAVIDPNISSNYQSGKGICVTSRLQYVAPLTMHCRPTASSEIPDLSFPVWHVMDLDVTIFFTSPYQQNRPMSMFRSPWIHSQSQNPTTLFSAYNSPINLPTVSPSPYCITSWSLPISARQLCTTFSTIKLNRVFETSPSWVISLVALNCRPWYTLWQVNIPCWYLNTAGRLHMWGSAPYPYKAIRRRPQYTASYSWWNSRKTRKRRSWSTLANSYGNFRFNIYIPVPLPERNPCRTSWR